MDMKADKNLGEYLIYTANVRLYKKSIVLVVGNNKLVFLTLGQVKKACQSNEDGETESEGFIVKITLSTFAKVYTFKNDFDGFSFSSDDTYDTLEEVSREQISSDSRISERGHIKMFAMENSIESL